MSAAPMLAGPDPARRDAPPWARWLFAPIDIAPLVYFRMVAGALIAIEMLGALVYDYHRSLVEPQVHFSYLLVPWLGPGPPATVYLHFWFNIAMAICVSIGFRYRIAATLLCVGSTSLVFMERALYINHLYLYCLVSGILAVLPAHRALSVDARLGATERAGDAPAWGLYLVRFQIGVVYLYAAIAKMHGDWVSGDVMHEWLSARAHLPVIGSVLALPSAPMAMSWGGLAFDLLVVPALLWPRTRKIAFFVALAFHLTNVAVFGLGTFPWFSIAITALFFAPASFRRRWPLRGRLPAAGTLDTGPNAHLDDSTPTGWARWAVIAPLSFYVLVQAALPTVHFFYPGNVSWTEEGHHFAWRMMARAKSGSLTYEVRDPQSGQTWEENPFVYVTRWQYRKLVGNPDMILQMAHFLARKYAAAGHPGVEVRARSSVSLNRRPAQALVDPTVDLATERRTLAPYPFIVPLAAREPPT